MKNARTARIIAGLLIATMATNCLAAEDPQEPLSTGEPTLLKVTSDFEGGCGDVISIDQEKRIVRIAPTPHKDRGWPCWWYFKVTGIVPGETITIDMLLKVGNFGRPDRATYSEDRRTWLHTAPGNRDGDRMIYRQKITGKEAWFCWGPPFTPSDTADLVKQIAREHDFAEAFELCRTRENRPVYALRIANTEIGSKPQHGIWIQARQHAWESGSSWTCRGVIDWLLSDEASSLRATSEIVVVPIMDVDNVFRGAGGKAQKPQDHNRDWSDAPHWPSVAAAMKQIREMDSAGRFDLFIDLHNPGKHDRGPFFYMPPPDILSDKGKSNYNRFIDAAKANIRGPLPLNPNTRVSGPNYDSKWKTISKSWVALNTSDHVVAVTLEVTWDSPHSTTEGYRQVGRQLGQAINDYFNLTPPPSK